MGNEQRGCPNCDGRKCMDCVCRTVHDVCVEDCPDCCAVPAAPSVSTDHTDELREQTRDAEPSTGPWTPFAYEDGPAPRTFVTDGQGRRHHVFSENAAQHLNQRDAAVAELVGLRTEVDQLRGDNERLMTERIESEDWKTMYFGARAERDALQAQLDAVEQAAREHLPEAVGHNTLAEILAGIARQRDWQREQKDALQAKVERMRGKDDVALNRAAERDIARLEVAALQARIDAVTKLHVVDSGQCWHCDYEWPCPTVAALGVDPQKEPLGKREAPSNHHPEAYGAHFPTAHAAGDVDSTASPRQKEAATSPQKDRKPE